MGQRMSHPLGPGRVLGATLMKGHRSISGQKEAQLCRYDGASHPRPLGPIHKTKWMVKKKILEAGQGCSVYKYSEL